MSEIRMPIQKRGIEKRNRIIKSGFDLICDNGYHNVNTNEIASMAGVSVGILYQYFNDKKEIFIEGIKTYSANIMYPMVNVFESQKNNFNPGKLDELFSEMVDGFIKNHIKNKKAHNELSAMEHSDEDVAAILREEENRAIAKMCDMLRGGGCKINNLNEKMHVCYRLIDDYCHEAIYHRHDNLDYTIMRRVVVKAAVDILG